MTGKQMICMGGLIAAVFGIGACGGKDGAEILSDVGRAYESHNTLENVAYSFQIVKTGAEGAVGMGRRVLTDLTTGDSYTVESADGTVFREVLFWDGQGYLMQAALPDGWMEYEGENPEPSGWESFFAFRYAQEDAADVVAEETGDRTKVIVTLSDEALKRYRERALAGFVTEEGQSGADDALERAGRTAYRQGKAVFEIDGEGVLVSLKLSLVVEEPVVPDMDAGEEEGRAEFEIVTSFSVEEYNSDEILAQLREKASMAEK